MIIHIGTKIIANNSEIYRVDRYGLIIVKFQQKDKNGQFNFLTNSNNIK